jgi:hypothetical protein
MRSLIKPACLLAAAASLCAATAPARMLHAYAVLSEDAGAWPQILESVGFQAIAPGQASIFVIRPQTAASTGWTERVEQGAVVILEGQSSVAEMFGFQASKERVAVGSVVDVRRPKLSIVWQKALDLPRFTVPKMARVFATERWTGAPLVAGYRSGTGAVLWVAVSPGESGYERFPYLLHALADLGMEAPFRAANLWAFFDSSYRSRVDLDYFAARWRASGIAALHVAAWHFYESDPERDRYLRALIEACHRNAIAVYAWLELPHVSEQFWNDHPEWREKTALLQDAHLDWRKLMNLTNRDCFQAASLGIKGLIHRFNWDGVNLAEIYFESLEGAANSARFTPMNGDVRREFHGARGFDPLELFQTRKDAVSLRAFLDFRADLARRMQEEWIGVIEIERRVKPALDLVLTHVDDRFDTGMRDAIGADASRVLPLLEKHDFTFLIEDPATVWNLGPQRYPEIARRYKPLTRRPEKLAIDINIVDRYQDVYPTKQQTGTELFELVHLAANSFQRVALYFENSILPPDLPLLSAAGAVVPRVTKAEGKLVIESSLGIGVRWNGAAEVDGKPWPVGDGSVMWLPAGAHTIEPAASATPTRILDFNGELHFAQMLSASQIEVSYHSATRALALVERKPVRLILDGLESTPEFLQARHHYSLVLPRGQHLVTIETE